MDRLKPTRCCSMCGGLFPIQPHFGLAGNVYCHTPEHWRAVGLNPEEVAAAFEAYTQRHEHQRSQLRARMANLRAALEDPTPPEPPPAPAVLDDDDAAIQARFLRMLSWLDEPPKDNP